MDVRDSCFSPAAHQAILHLLRSMPCVLTLDKLLAPLEQGSKCQEVALAIRKRKGLKVSPEVFIALNV